MKYSINLSLKQLILLKAQQTFLEYTIRPDNVNFTAKSFQLKKFIQLLRKDYCWKLNSQLNNHKLKILQPRELMVLTFGVLIILIVIALNFAGSVRSSLKNVTAYRNLVEYSTSDRIFRLVQYLSLGLSSLQDKKSRQLTAHYTGLIASLNVKEFQKLTFMMSMSRKAIRFIRAPLLFKSIANRQMKMDFSSKQSALATLEKTAILGTDVSDLIFFLTDHFTVFYWFGLINGGNLLTNLITLGDIMWISASCFTFLLVYCTLEKNRMMFKNWSTFLAQKQVKIALMDIFIHTNEIILGFTFLYPGILQNQMVAVIALSSTSARLWKFNVK